MSKGNDSIGKTLTVAVLLCLACSLVVSTAAVMLKPEQVKNKILDRKSNILAAAGLLDKSEGAPGVEEQFEAVTPRLVNFDTGKYSDQHDPTSFEQVKAAKDPALSTDLSSEQDIAKIQRRENYGVVYEIRKNGELEKLILPVRGYGLWSTLYGFVALESDLNTVAGLGFYEHGETPGLGGEVDNPNWKAKWPGKEVYDDGEVALRLEKGAWGPEAEHKVDALSGATLTSVGITNLVKFWMGEQGYRAFLENLKAGDA